MNVWRLVIHEIRHRRLSAAVTVGVVALVCALVVSQLVLLGAHDQATETILAEKKAATEQRLKQLRADVSGRAERFNDEMRVIMKRMGFNIWILPKDQDLTDLYSDGYASKLMPEQYVTTLAESRIITVRHLLPILERKVKWPEQGGRTIILVGTRGEVPVIHKKAKQPIGDPVAPGEIVLGYEIAKGLQLDIGAKIVLLGEQFTVTKRHGERGTKDDVTVWINLPQAQRMLDAEGQINAILALECSCAWADLAKVREEITRILPETQVKELHTKALARAEARRRAADLGEMSIRRVEREESDALAQEKHSRTRIRQEKQALMAVFVPLALIVCAAWVGAMSYANVRRRGKEIGILRAVGLSGRQIGSLVVLRAGLLGLAGSVGGVVFGWMLALPWAEQRNPVVMGAAGGWLIYVAIGAVLVCIAGSWPPAVVAERQDPAVLLREE